MTNLKNFPGVIPPNPQSWGGRPSPDPSHAALRPALRAFGPSLVPPPKPPPPTSIPGYAPAYKHFYQLIVYLLTLPVTSASCERSHSKVDLIKSAVRSSLTSGRLENLVAMACEKKILDSITNSTIVARFASEPRVFRL
jgi:hypothetical protein